MARKEKRMTTFFFVSVVVVVLAVVALFVVINQWGDDDTDANTPATNNAGTPPVEQPADDGESGVPQTQENVPDETPPGE